MSLEFLSILFNLVYGSCSKLLQFQLQSMFNKKPKYIRNHVWILTNFQELGQVNYPTFGMFIVNESFVQVKLEKTIGRSFHPSEPPLPHP